MIEFQSNNTRCSHRSQTLTAHYSAEVKPDPSQLKRGRLRIHPERRRDPELQCRQVVKEKDSQDRVMGVRRRMVFGSVAQLRKRFPQTAHHQSPGA